MDRNMAVERADAVNDAAIAAAGVASRPGNQHLKKYVKKLRDLG